MRRQRQTKTWRKSTPTANETKHIAASQAGNHDNNKRASLVYAPALGSLLHATLETALLLSGSPQLASRMRPLLLQKMMSDVCVVVKPIRSECLHQHGTWTTMNPVGMACSHHIPRDHVLAPLVHWPQWHVLHHQWSPPYRSTEAGQTRLCSTTLTRNHRFPKCLGRQIQADQVQTPQQSRWQRVYQQRYIRVVESGEL